MLYEVITSVLQELERAVHEACGHQRVGEAHDVAAVDQGCFPTARADPAEVRDQREVLRLTAAEDQHAAAANVT